MCVFYGCFNRDFVNFTFLLSSWGVTLQIISLVIEQAVVTKTCTYRLSSAYSTVFAHGTILHVPMKHKPVLPKWFI